MTKKTMLVASLALIAVAVLALMTILQRKYKDQ